MIRRIRRSLPWLGAVAALLLLALPVQADEIEPEPYLEEELEPEPELEVEAEEETETAPESNRDVGKISRGMLIDRAFFDVLVIRPFYFARLVIGLPFFVFHPLTLASGWNEEFVTGLWTEPYEATFERPLGAPLGDY